eukprot:3340504-Pyramimonas_sp.AAC.1
MQRPWAAVRDPVSALVLTLARVGWGLRAGGRVLADREGCEFDVERFSPAFLAARVKEDTRQAASLE